ncbi:CobW family GTP-binding protein [Ottowia caeni]|uniref:CobW family GTP-binding protein n=1 Tax=Ottowia caeni TaxID=2870339 RepID=UPI001E405614|nr:GTP-binding protein [Ottowia caeni]
MKAEPIPVWLVTGYLGSGKTTLLARWLRHEALADAALIINEIGEVGFDDRILARSMDSASMLLADQCICCSGLPGLQDALTELWWARLRRERPRFNAVIIETTGIADPRPMARLFDLVPLLRERYVLRGIVTVVSSVAGLQLLANNEETKGQVEAADVLVVTKTDLKSAQADALADILHAGNGRAPVLRSAKASVDWQDIITAAARVRQPVVRGDVGAIAPASGLFHRKMAPSKGAAASHGARSTFHPHVDPVTLDEWPRWLGPLLAPELLRLKGVVRLNDQTLAGVQWSLGDALPEFTPYAGPTPVLGITTIYSTAAAKSQNAV